MSTDPSNSTEGESAKSPTPTSSSSGARARAMARRKRILEQSKNRMNVVAGNAPTTEDKPVVTDDAEDSNRQESETLTDKNTETSDANTATTTDADSPPPTTKVSTSARMAQMRRARYKKKAAEIAAAKEECKPDDAAEAGASEEEAKVVTVEEVAEEPPKTTLPDESKGEDKKKYMGVAKMRRKRLAEKKALKDKEDAEEMGSSSNKHHLKALKGPRPVALGPILVQLFTVLLLFIVGFDVGIQNHALVNQEVPNVHTNLSYIDHGVGVFSIFANDKKSANLEQDNNMDYILEETTDDDEFGNADEPKPAGATADAPKSANIDPVFGVDFDKITAGDSFFLMFARFAVSIHRTFTYFFFTAPIALFHKICSTPKRMLTNPPILFLCALIIRYLGKHVLGGNIPKLDELIEADIKGEMDPTMIPGKKGGLESIASTDFMSMGKNFASNYAKKNFPRVVMAFMVFKDARSDMFVILCGFFVGLVVPAGIMGGTIGSDEL